VIGGNRQEALGCQGMGAFQGVGVARREGYIKQVGGAMDVPALSTTGRRRSSRYRRGSGAAWCHELEAWMPDLLAAAARREPTVWRASTTGRQRSTGRLRGSSRALRSSSSSAASQLPRCGQADGMGRA
jgi:hypothetical protein